MADEKHVADKRPDDDKKYEDVREKRHVASHIEKREGEDLTPTPTQAEMDKIMSGLSDEDLAKAKKPEAREGVEAHHPTPESTPPTLTQDENDAAMELAAPGDDLSDPKRKEKKEAEAKRRKEEEDKRRKDMEAEHPAGYQTRATSPKPRP